MGNPWLDHVKATAAKNKGMKFKEVLKAAKKTYKKVAKAVTGKKKARKTRKNKKKSSKRRRKH